MIYNFCAITYEIECKFDSKIPATSITLSSADVN